MAMHGYNFTERVRKVLSMAREQANRLHHEYVGTEHILLALVAEGEGVSSVVLENIGVDAAAVRRRVLDALREGHATFDRTDLPYTSRAKKVLELSMHEARSLQHTYVGTEHILLGLLAEEKGIAAQVLMSLGCTLAKAREETLRVLGTETIASQDTQPIGTLTAHAFGGSLPRRVGEVVAAAQLLAGRSGSPGVRAEHLLLAILQHGEGSAIAVLERLSVDCGSLARSIETALEAERRPANPEATLDSGSLGMLMMLAEQERSRSDAPLLSTHHLLLAIAQSRSRLVQSLLGEADVTADAIRQEARRITG